jgi:hypothetical protein
MSKCEQTVSGSDFRMHLSYSSSDMNVHVLNRTDGLWLERMTQMTQFQSRFKPCEPFVNPVHALPVYPHVCECNHEAMLELGGQV